MFFNFNFLGSGKGKTGFNMDNSDQVPYFDQTPDLGGIRVTAAQDFNDNILENAPRIGQEGETIGRNHILGLENASAIYINDGVIGIDKWAFSNYKNLREIRLPESLRVIEDCAFYGCEQLNGISLPKSLEKLGTYVFYDSGLWSVCFCGDIREIPESTFAECRQLNLVMHNSGVIEKIGKNAFSNCTNLTDTHFIMNVNELGENAFQGCENIGNIEFEGNITEIPDGAFKDCKCLSMELPCGIKRVGKEAFAGCTGLIDLSLPSTITEFGQRAFSGCTGLWEVDFHGEMPAIDGFIFEGCTKLYEVKLPRKLKRIGHGVFADCKNLTKVEFPETLEEIGQGAFSGCVYLRDINLPTGMRGVGSSAFYGCEGLKKIVLPKSIETIGADAFKDCKQLEDIKFEDGITMIPDFALRELDCVKQIELPQSVKVIGISSFRQCKSLEKVILNEGIERIGANAFCECQNLREIVFPESMREIGKDAFKNCENLTRVVLPKSIQVMEPGIFRDCKSLEKVEIEEGITKIPDITFWGCSGLKQIKLPESLEVIGQCAFSDCENLREIVFPKSMKEIGMGAFQKCLRLDKIVFQGDIERIGKSAFIVCGELLSNETENSVKKSRNNSKNPDGDAVPLNVQELGKSAFNNCKSLLNRPIKVIKKIEENAFVSCEDIREIELGDDITEVPEGAFKGCKNLSKVKVSENVRTIGKEAFFGCKKLSEAELPKEIDKIDDYAFAGCKKLSSIGKNADDNGKSVREVGEGAFFRCLELHTGFKDIEKLGKDSFFGCFSMRKVSFNDGIEEIPVRAFSDCASLTKVVFPKSVRKIGMLAFDNCSKLTSITFGNKNNIERIENYAFAGCRNLRHVKPELKPDIYATDAFKGCYKTDLDKSTESNHFNILDEQFFLDDREDKMVDAGPIIIEDKSEIPLFSEGGPKIEDIAQREMGDCWLLAALGSIVNFKPGFIKHIMTDNPENGTVSVKFQREIQGQFRTEVYTVKKSIFKAKVIDRNQTIMSELQGCLWPQMMEKAFAAYLDNYRDLRNFNSIYSSRDNFFGDKRPFKVILGRFAESSGEDVRLGGDPKTLFERIQRNLQNGMPMTFSTNYKLNDFDVDEVQNHHSYSLVGAEEREGRYYINLRNPWGYNWDKNHNKKDAVITVDLEEAIRAGSWISNFYK